MVRRILTITFTALALGLAYYLYNSIRSDVEETARIDKIERSIIEKLQVIRTAQKAYLSVEGTYADNWGTLILFILSGDLYITERKESIVALEYGADSVLVQIDTLGTIAVRDSLFASEEFINYDFNRLAYTPHAPDQEFLLFTGSITRGGVPVEVIEVTDPAPVNNKRSSDSELRSLKPLHFGSRASVSLAGNWE